MLHGEKPKYVRQVVSGGNIVDSGYLNPFSNEIVLNAEKLQLQAVVQLLKDHPAIRYWNLGNEPDIFAFPANDVVREK
jgi:hypothetical protein